MCLDASLARMEAQLGRWKATLARDQTEAFDDVAALVALLRDLTTAGREHAAAIRTGLQSAWREFSSAVENRN